MREERFESQVHLIGGEDDETATISCSRDATVCRVLLRYRDQAVFGDALDFFGAFCNVRRDLEKAKLIPFCYGASLDVYPSGMCRDMGQGLLAYRLTQGAKPSQNDLVRIFDEGPDVVPAFVSLQKEFYDDWLPSIGVNKRSSP